MILKEDRIIRKMFDILARDYPGRRFAISADGEMITEIKRKRPVAACRSSRTIHFTR